MLFFVEFCWFQPFFFFSMFYQKESCPICYIDFSTQNQPFLTVCGHSFCSQCTPGIRSCPLCRRKLPQGRAPVKNYSLLSLVEKVESTLDVEKKEQQTQTESIETHTIEATPKKKRPPKAESEKKAMNFKLTQDKAGQLKGITIKFAN